MAKTSSPIPRMGIKPKTEPSMVQKRYLTLGVDQPGGKLPLFDREGQKIKAATIRACMAQGWCKPWFANPIEPSWLVCKLTKDGLSAIGGRKSKRMVN